MSFVIEIETKVGRQRYVTGMEGAAPDYTTLITEAEPYTTQNEARENLVALRKKYDWLRFRAVIVPNNTESEIKND